ncbi:MAG: type I restriction enzyme HsdR N-terminal domain-containing protein [Flavobacteriaceae bacterium]|jgi:predicted type IV restriction endonuclease
MEQDILNLPPARFKVKNTENRRLIWDVIRKKYLPLTPEEWVRQHVVHFLMHHKNVPTSRILLERAVHTAQKRSRFDIALTSSDGRFTALIECKASTVKLDAAAVYQMQRYAYELRPELLVLTNGLQHLIFQWNDSGQSYHQIENLPDNL